MAIRFGIGGNMGFAQRFYEILAEKNQERGWQTAFAQKIGISQSALSKIISGETKSPELGSIAAIVDALADEFYADAPSIKRIAPHAPIEKVTGPGLKTINVYSVAGAGPGIEVGEIEPLFQVTAPPDYFRRSDYAIVVDGHSMEPLIAHGSIVGIKLHAPFVANELYVARIPYEGLVIKRVGVDRATNEFIFKSENPNKENYPDFRVNIDESEGIIVGRVVWVMWGY